MATGDIQDARHPLDVLAEWLLIGLLAFMPLAFGVVHAWSEEIVIITSGVIVALFLLKIVMRRGAGVVWSWAYVPIAVFILIVIVQLVPLPSWLIGRVSPETARLKGELLAGLGTSPDGPATLSFYSHGTIHDLRLLLAAAGVFVVVLNTFRRRDQIRRLLTAVAAIGGLIACIALAQNILGNEKIYWVIPTRYGRCYSCPFINHSNFAQFMNLSMGAALGLVIVKLHTAFGAGRFSVPALFDYFGRSTARGFWALVAVLGLGSASIFVSLSRGGAVSMLIAMAATTLLLSRRRSLRGAAWLMVLIALVATVCVLYVGFDGVYARFASLRGLGRADGGRWEMLSSSLALWARFPVLGSGLGTHSVVYPMFDHSTVTELARYAENEYAQVVEETGLIGLATLLVFGVIVLVAHVRALRQTDSPTHSVAYGLAFGLLAILVHSVTDFGQHLPANGILSGVFCALILVLGQSQGRLRGDRRRANPAWRTVLAVVALLGVVGVYAWAGLGAHRARRAEAQWRRAGAIEKKLAENNWRASDSQFAQLTTHASSAVSDQPENARYRYWLAVFQWRRARAGQGGAGMEHTESEQLLQVARELVGEFDQVCRLCPTFGPAHSMAGQLEYFVIGRESGAQRIRRGFDLAPCDPVACFVAGYLDVVEGKLDDCVAKFDRAVALDDKLFDDVVNVYVDYLSRPDLAMSSAGNDVGRLHYVAGVLDDAGYQDLAANTRRKMMTLLETECAEPDAPAWAFVYLGDIYKRQDRVSAAIECYRKALARDYGQVDWRLDLARLLAESQHIPEAMREARICLRLRPGLKAAERLVADCAVHPAGFDIDDELP